MVHMDNCSVCVRWSVFAMNCLVWLGGSVMLGLGIWITTQDTEYKHLAGNLYVTIGYIVLSSFVFIIGFVGSCGILLMKDNLLKMYFALMFVLLLAELGVAIYLYIEKDKIPDHIATNWNKTTDEARINIQKEFECCGLKPQNLNHKSSSDKSCFVDNDPEKGRLEDCYTHLMDWTKKNHIILATCSVIVAVMQMLILGGTCRLIAQIESGDRMVTQTRVVPLNIQPIDVRQMQMQHWNPGPINAQPMAVRQIQMQQWNPGTIPQPARAEAEEVRQSNTATPLSEDSEDGPLRSTITRKKWAKIHPKYNPVFSLLD
ncbi:tetraspanin-9-like isoform X1 [Stylophora pistillata]|uniref:Leukocyte surface antigen CD53 n=1 Tax=Stylophora pistillata TaxID=50429 RepID=A0A2B4RQG0_STYPI|nr:tetraspanin-9-like isoform X1 [Stylophora pistillata]PFX20674.1 Leukocyte surface antigen CD53 [Stylophora pistillata]